MQAITVVACAVILTSPEVAATEPRDEALGDEALGDEALGDEALGRLITEASQRNAERRETTNTRTFIRELEINLPTEAISKTQFSAYGKALSIAPDLTAVHFNLVRYFPNDPKVTTKRAL